MAQIVVRNLDPDVVERLRSRAKQHHRSLEAEVRGILEAEAGPSTEQQEKAIRFLDALRARLAGKITRDSVDLIREDRDR